MGIDDLYIRRWGEVALGVWIEVWFSWSGHYFEG